MKKVIDELSIQIDEETIIKVLEVKKLFKTLTVRGKPDLKAWEILVYLTTTYPDEIHFNELNRKLENVSRVTLNRKLKMLIERGYVTRRQQECEHKFNKTMYKISNEFPELIRDLYESYHVKPKYVKEVFKNEDIDVLTIFFVDRFTKEIIDQLSRVIWLPNDFSYFSRGGFYHLFDTVCEAFQDMIKEQDKKTMQDTLNKIKNAFEKALIDTFGEKGKIMFP